MHVDRKQLSWRKSRQTQANGQFVEVARIGPRLAVRDSRDPQGGVVILGKNQWSIFIHNTKTGTHDLP